MSRLMDEFLAEATKEANKEYASRLLKHDIPIEVIAECCKLSLDEVIALQAEFNKT